MVEADPSAGQHPTPQRLQQAFTKLLESEVPIVLVK
jgi:hypothetical protein